MKPIKLLLSLFFVISFTLLNAQSVILKGGVNISNISITDDGDIEENNSLTSFQAGLLVDIPIISILSIQPGVVLTGKGSKTESGDPSGPTFWRATTNPYYVEVPVNLILKTPTGPVKFFGGAGPYLGIGVAGKNKVNGKLGGVAFSSEEDIEWSDDDPSTLDYEEGAGFGILKRFDYGVNITAGIQFTKAVLAINYGHGLAKLQSGSNSSADDKNKHRVLSFTLGFRL